MDLRKLSVFCKVYELRSFSRAGEETYLSQPTVSGHIKYLEDILDVRLFDRLGREVIPTKAGDILYQYSEKMIRLRDEAIQALRTYLGRVQGELVIGGSTIPGDYILPRLLGGFNAAYPDVKVLLQVSDTREIVKRILEARVEIGMVGARIEEEHIEYIPFMYDQLILVSHPEGPPAPDHELSPRELTQLPFIVREAGSGTLLSIQRILSSMQLDLKDLKVVAELGNTESVRQGIKAGLGLSIISDTAVKEDIENGALRVVPLEGLPIRRDFYLAMHRDRTHSPICKAFLSFCQKVGEKRLSAQ